MKLAALALVVAACGGGAGPRGVEPLRLELAQDPTDGDTHRDLAWALERAGRPGGALRHFEEARRRGDLDAAGERELGRLYAARAAARVALGDGEAWRDIEAAHELGGSVAAEVAREAELAGALAAYRRGDRPGRAQGAAMLRRALGRQPRDSRRVLLDLEGADPPSLARAAAWLAEGGARRVALETYTVYIDRGGRVVEHVRRYLALHRWWYGDRERPGGLLLADARDANIDPAAPPPLPATPDAHAAARGPAIERIRRAYRRDPALADRMADDLADGAVALGQRAPALIALYRELGDPARAWRWAERLHRSSPHDTRYLMLAGECSAAAGDPARADVFFVRAAAASGDAGGSNVAAARIYLDTRQPLAAVAAARRAISLTARGTAEHAQAIELAAAALEAIGRGADAAELRATVGPPAR